MPSAAYNLGMLLARQNDLKGAFTAFQLAAHSGDTDVGRKAAEWIANNQQKHLRISSIYVRSYNAIVVTISARPGELGLDWHVERKGDDTHQ